MRALRHLASVQQFVYEMELMFIFIGTLFPWLNVHVKYIKKLF